MVSQMSHIPHENQSDDALPVAVPIATKPRGFVKGVMAMQRNALFVLPRIAFTQPIVSGQVVRRFHMVMDPPSLRRVLKDAAADYPKSEESQAMLRPALGNGLFLADGAHWRWQRRAAMPVFAPRNLTALTPVMTEAAEAAASRLVGRTGPVDLYQEMLRTAFEVIAAVSMSSDTAIPRDVAHRAIDRYLTTAGRASVLDILQVPRFVPRPARLLGAALIADLKRAADRAIEARRAATRTDPKRAGARAGGGARGAGRPRRRGRGCSKADLCPTDHRRGDAPLSTRRDGVAHGDGARSAPGPRD